MQDRPDRLHHAVPSHIPSHAPKLLARMNSPCLVSRQGPLTRPGPKLFDEGLTLLARQLHVSRYGELALARNSGPKSSRVREIIGCVFPGIDTFVQDVDASSGAAVLA